MLALPKRLKVLPLAALLGFGQAGSPLQAQPWEEETLQARSASPQGGKVNTGKGLLSMACLCLLATESSALGAPTTHANLSDPSGPLFLDGPHSQVFGQVFGEKVSPRTLSLQAAAPTVPLNQALTELLMQQLAPDSLEQFSPIMTRAVAAQRTLLQNSLGSALTLVGPQPPNPGAQLIQGAIQMALTDTAFDIMSDLLPPGFGPVPPRRTPRNSPSPSFVYCQPVCTELQKANVTLQAAKSDLVAAIREAKSVGSDIAIAATSLLAYGAFSSVAYGLDLGASVASIFDAVPPTQGAVASGTLAAIANGFWVAAYSNAAVAGAIAIQKLRDPYIDVLMKLGDAEVAWQDADSNYRNLSLQLQGACLPVNGSGCASSSSTGSGANALSPGVETSERSSSGSSEAASPSDMHANETGGCQTSDAEPAAKPFWSEWF